METEILKTMLMIIYLTVLAGFGILLMIRTRPRSANDWIRLDYLADQVTEELKRWPENRRAELMNRASHLLRQHRKQQMDMLIRMINRANTLTEKLKHQHEQVPY
ncbi:MAG: hypothetical protein HUU10_12850 [Bacteroidetes bacterium]|nr:hypothetical protein [Bacteroidota bacterium]